MRVYATMDVDLPLADVPAYAARAEALGFDGLIVPEAVHDGVLVALLALEHTRRLRVATGVIVAFARSPTLVAQQAWDLQRLSGGRFAIGLGSQIRANVEGRFGMPWSAPAARMRDYVRALRAVFACWQDGGRLDYAGEHYRLSRMQPFFRPGALEDGIPPVWLGGIGRSMQRVAGEVADALLTHPTNAGPAYLREVVRPALSEGAARAGRAADDVAVIASPLTATGPAPDVVSAERERVRGLLAFLYSTPAYRPTLDHHGWGDLQTRLRESSARERWDEMPALIPDELLDALVPTGTYDEIASELRARYAGLATGVTLQLPSDTAWDEAFGRMLGELRAG